MIKKRVLSRLKEYKVGAKSADQGQSDVKPYISPEISS